MITAAVLKLFPKPRGVEHRLRRREGPGGGARASSRSRATSPGSGLTAFELIPRIGIDFLLRHLPGARDPLAAPTRLVRALRDSRRCTPRPRPSGSSRRSSGKASTEGSSRTASAPRVARAGRRASGGSATPCPKCSGRRAARSSTTSPCRSRPCRSLSSEAAPPSWPSSRARGPSPSAIIGDGNIHFNFSQPIGAGQARLPGPLGRGQRRRLRGRRSNSAEPSRPSTASAS